MLTFSTLLLVVGTALALIVCVLEWRSRSAHRPAPQPGAAAVSLGLVAFRDTSALRPGGPDAGHKSS